MGFGFSCVVAGLEKLSLNLTQAVKKIGCDVGASRTRDRKLTVDETWVTWQFKLGAKIRNFACGDQWIFLAVTRLLLRRVETGEISCWQMG